MDNLITAIVIAVLGALAGILAVTKKGSDKDNYVAPPKDTQADKAEQDAEEESAKISKEIADESKANIVKRFFDAFSHGPYTDSSPGDNNSTGNGHRGSTGSTGRTGGNGG